MGRAARRAAACACALVLAASPAWANHDDDDDDDDPPPPPPPAFRYTTKATPDYLRASLELVGILSIGFGQYSLNAGNSVDWDLGYDWPSFRSKLLLDAASLDNNRFDTNWLSHPFAGYWYYTAARSNRMPAFAAYAMAVSASYLWELIGEMREQISYNDVVVTPTSGFVLGEHTTQLGSLLQRSRPSSATHALSWVLAPFKNAHDRIDGLEPAPPDEYRKLGLAGDVSHELAGRMLAGATSQDAGLTQADTRAELRSRIVSLPSYGRIGQRDRWFYEGEVSAVDIGTTFSTSGMTDLSMLATLVPAGYFFQDTHVSAKGKPRGQSFLGGLLFAFEYGHHDYDRDRGRPIDKLALVGTGPSLEYTVYAGATRFRASTDAFTSFAGVNAYAMPPGAIYDPRFVASGVRVQRYYHGYGGTLRPRLEASFGALDVGGEARFDWFGSVRGLDREQRAVVDETTLSDRRVLAKTWVGFTPQQGFRLTMTAQRLARAGRLGSQHASRHEVTVMGGAEVSF